MKRLILLLAILGSAFGAWHSYQTRNQFIQAALLSEAFNLTAPVKLRVADYFVRQGIMPHDNAAAELPPPRSIYGTSVTRVAIHRGGVLRVDFDDAVGLSPVGSALARSSAIARHSMVFTPSVSPVSGLLSWRCTSDSITPDVLDKLRPRCHFLPATRESRMMEAIAVSDLPVVQRLLEEGASASAVVNGNTPLMLAAKIGNVSVVKSLLDEGAPVDNGALGAERRTPLMVAISSGQAEVVSVLLAHGASVNIMDYRNWTAREHARATDERLGGQRFTLLVSAGHHPDFAGNAAGRISRSASVETDAELASLYLELAQAATDCHVQRLSSLLRARSDLSPAEQIDGRPLSSHIDKPACSQRLAGFLLTRPTFQQALQARFSAVVARCDARETESLLREHTQIDLLRRTGRASHFQRAVIAGCNDVVDVMIRERNIDSDALDGLLVLAIEKAPQDSLVRLIGSVLAIGVDVNRASVDGLRPLDAAIAFEQPVVAKYLIDAGADVNIMSGRGSYPIIEATKKGYSHLVRQMLSRGAEVDGRDTLGRTALLVAVANGRQRLVDVLLRAGADARVKDTNGVDALVLAESRNHQQIRTLLTSSVIR